MIVVVDCACRCLYPTPHQISWWNQTDTNDVVVGVRKQSEVNKYVQNGIIDGSQLIIYLYQDFRF